MYMYILIVVVLDHGKNDEEQLIPVGFLLWDHMWSRTLSQNLKVAGFKLLFLTVSTNALHSTNSLCCFSRCQAPTSSVDFCI